MPDNIGRFKLNKVLGKGSQGIVYLAKDPILDREVAIKTLHSSVNEKDTSTSQLLMDEAKIISKMSHPNIVSIFEAGEQDGNIYLVFEYVRGETLTEAIKQRKFKSVHDTLNLFRQICEGMAHAQQHNIVHGDLKPANIILDQQDRPKIMDFGIAPMLSSQAGNDNLYGTPRYMPPEYLMERVVTQANDVYSLGLILFELLTGEMAVPGRSIKEIVNNAVHGKIRLPQNCHRDVSELFENIVIRATEKNHINRFASISEMLKALNEFVESHNQQNLSSKAQDAAVTFLLRKIERKQDFPALSQTLIKINTMMEKDKTNVQQLSAVIAEDFALTNKILKLVNSAFYRISKSEIKTLSQAVLMLGFDEIRSLAMSLILIDHLHHKAKAERLKQQVINSIYSGIMAKDLSSEVKLKNHEESFLSATFHQLGELLVLYYFFEEVEEIDKLMNEEKLTKEQAALKILGVSFQKLGMEIARLWKLPHYIINNITPYKLADNNNREINSPEEKLQAITSLSNQLSNSLADKENEDWRKSAVGVWRNYSNLLSLQDDALKIVADKARKNLIEVNHIFNINLQKSDIMKRAELLNHDVEESDNTNTGMNKQKASTAKAKVEKPKAKKQPDKMLSSAIDMIQQEITSKNRVSQILLLIFKALQDSFDVERLVISLFDHKSGGMVGKLNHGLSEHFLQSFVFKVKKPEDVFQMSCLKGVDVFINDTEEFEKKKKLPPWYRQIIDAQAFMLLPINYQNKPFALIYLDHSLSGALVIEQSHLKQLRQLRDLCVRSLELSKMRSGK